MNSSTDLFTAVASGEPATPAWAAPIEASSQVVSLSEVLDTTEVPAPDQAGSLGGAWNAGYRDGFTAGAEEGRAAGVSAGYEDGLAAGRDEARREITTILASIQGAAERLVALEAATAASIEARVVELAMAVATVVVGRELAVATDPGADALRRALALAPERGAVTARLHPEDLDRLAVDPASLLPGREVRLIPDPSVGHGGCELDVGAARVDARVDTALERVRAVLAE